MTELDALQSLAERHVGGRQRGKFFDEIGLIGPKRRAARRVLVNRMGSLLRIHPNLTDAEICTILDVDPDELASIRYVR